MVKKVKSLDDLKRGKVIGKTPPPERLGRGVIVGRPDKAPFLPPDLTEIKSRLDALSRRLSSLPTPEHPDYSDIIQSLIARVYELEHQLSDKEEISFPVVELVTPEEIEKLKKELDELRENMNNLKIKGLAVVGPKGERGIAGPSGVPGTAADLAVDTAPLTGTLAGVSANAQSMFEEIDGFKLERSSLHLFDFVPAAEQAKMLGRTISLNDQNVYVQAALDELAASTLVDTLVIPPVLISAYTTATASTPGIKIKGEGSPGIILSWDDVPTTYDNQIKRLMFQWEGTAGGGPILSLSDPGLIGGYNGITGLGLERIFFRGLNQSGTALCGIGLELQGLNASTFDLVSAYGFSDVAIDLARLYDTTTGAMSIHNTFSRLFIAQNHPDSGHCIWTSDRYTTNNQVRSGGWWFNEFFHLFLVHRDGDGIRLQACDNLKFKTVGIARHKPGTGDSIGVHGTNHVDAYTPASCEFDGLSVGAQVATNGWAGPIRVYGTETYTTAAHSGPYINTIHGLDKGNGAMPPVLGTGCSPFLVHDSFSHIEGVGLIGHSPIVHNAVSGTINILFGEYTVPPGWVYGDPVVGDWKTVSANIQQINLVGNTAIAIQTDIFSVSGYLHIINPSGYTVTITDAVWDLGSAVTDLLFESSIVQITVIAGVKYCKTIHKNSTVTNTTGVRYGSTIGVDVNRAGSGSNSAIGLSLLARKLDNYDMSGGLTGAQFLAVVAGAGSISAAEGLTGSTSYTVVNNAGAVVSYPKGGIDVGAYLYAGEITYAIGRYIKNVVKYGGTTLGGQAGLYIEPISGASGDNLAISSAGGKSIHMGDFDINGCYLGDTYAYISLAKLQYVTGRLECDYPYSSPGSVRLRSLSGSGYVDICNGIGGNTGCLVNVTGVGGTYDWDASVLAGLSTVTASAAELNFVDGVTSAIQVQLNNKVNATDTAVTTGALVAYSGTSGVDIQECITTKTALDGFFARTPLAYNTTDRAWAAGDTSSTTYQNNLTWPIIVTVVASLTSASGRIKILQSPNADLSGGVETGFSDFTYTTNGSLTCTSEIKPGWYYKCFANGANVRDTKAYLWVEHR